MAISIVPSISKIKCLHLLNADSNIGSCKRQPHHNISKY